MKSQIVISALGVVNALGASVDKVAARLFAGDQSGIKRSTAFVPDKDYFVGEVQEELPSCPDGFKDLWSRNAALSLVALRQIQEQVNLAISKYGPSRIGIVVGSSTSGIDESERVIRARVETACLSSGYVYQQQQLGTVSLILSKLLGVTGPSYTISTACSSSAKVFRAARNLMTSGLCDCVVAGGIDSLCKLTLNGFSSLELVSDQITNPFSKNRRGITIGEGGALFLLERAKQDTHDEASVYLLGVGESSDAYHISSPDPTAAGAIVAIEAALTKSGVSAKDIDYINLHGTGTLHNDAMEAKAIRHIFSERVPCSSTKPLVGHMLGASGATEVAFCWMMLTDSAWRIPPHRFDGERDPELPFLNLASSDARCESVPQFALSNSFGFGGSNCAVVLGRRLYGAR